MPSITILNKENVPQGPFTRSEVADKLTRGDYTLDSLAFVEGLSQWTPLRDVLTKVDGVAPAPQPAPFVTAPPATASPATFATAPAPAAPITPAYSYAATMQPPEHLVYAGFWLRFAAIFVDGLILLPLAIISVIISVVDNSTTDESFKLLLAIISLLYSLICLVLQWLYFALQESSAAQATLGKRLLGIQVTDRQGHRIGFGRATGRYFGKIVSGLILYIGFMMAGWTQRKQALHDMMADTLVVRKPGA
jgi:uncharacterized RDD family membrane protein YckC